MENFLTLMMEKNQVSTVYKKKRGEGGWGGEKEEEKEKSCLVTFGLKRSKQMRENKYKTVRLSKLVSTEMLGRGNCGVSLKKCAGSVENQI